MKDYLAKLNCVSGMKIVEAKAIHPESIFPGEAPAVKLSPDHQELSFCSATGKI